MTSSAQIDAAESTASLSSAVEADAQLLSAQLQDIRNRLFPPSATKTLRKLGSGEAAKLIGCSDGYLRQLDLSGEGPTPEKGVAGRRLYTLEQVHEIRELMARTKPAYSRHRKPGERLQVIAVTNFKGGSAKTTTTAHLAQYLAMRGYRTLAIDLDPQASLTSLLGLQPEFDVGPGETLYGAIRYEDEVPLKDVIRQTYFAGLDLVPANLELQEFEHDTPRVLAEKRRSSDRLFFARVAHALATVDDAYDVVVLDCPPALGFLTLSALCAARSVLITIHPQMLDIASMSQFLHMTASLLKVVERAGGDANYDFLRYLVTRYEPQDGPQTRIVGLMRSLFGERVMTNPMLKSTAIADAGITKQTLYEVGKGDVTRQTYDRAIESLDAVNGEIEEMILRAWGRA